MVLSHNDLFINLIDRIIFQKWYVEVTLIINAEFQISNRIIFFFHFSKVNQFLFLYIKNYKHFSTLNHNHILLILKKKKIKETTQ